MDPFFVVSAFKIGSTFNGVTELRLGKMGFGNYKNSFNGAVKSGYPLYSIPRSNQLALDDEACSEQRAMIFFI